MLTRCERQVMDAVYCLCDGLDGCLVSPRDIVSVIPAKSKLSVEKIDDALISLKRDEYLDFIPSERKGERMYVISLKESGLNYKRNKIKRRQDVVFKIFLAMIGAAATFVFGVVLKAVFG